MKKFWGVLLIVLGILFGMAFLGSIMRFTQNMSVENSDELIKRIIQMIFHLVLSVFFLSKGIKRINQNKK